ncbi:hypothetical protein BUALT_Bualt04G0131100 [Buddleja alternifolia]|uniref:BHLH domain-containing protein n=1 Tax=Buddleja alternifolia TaxID=168488 RepID=A0AAV6XNI6_9LAMI|nr:hypothetical protein BUALT_Bualt04G0131100 [Buddleja alternifolia]
MVRTVNIVEDEDTPDSSSPRESKRGNQKGNALRSKHSETEQRRRSKINERQRLISLFQILRDLIPENDQKRDKASFLLEVIQYIQFLHEKLQMYEGSGRGWSPESAKLTPWRINSGPVESFIDQSHIEGLLSNHEENIVLNPTLLSSGQNSVESDLTGAVSHNPADNLPMVTDQDLAPVMPLQPLLLEGVPGQPQRRSLPDAEQFTQQSRAHFWRGTSYVDDCSVPIYTTNEEELKSENGEASISSAYSQGILNSLTNALQSSGVDLSQANVSVQLDVRRRTNDESTAAIFCMKVHPSSSSHMLGSRYFINLEG